MRSPVLDLRESPGRGAEGVQCGRAQRPPLADSAGRPRQPEFTAQATRQERAARQGENPTGLQRPPSSMQDSTDQGMCVRKLPEAGKELVALTLGHSAPSTDSM